MEFNKQIRKDEVSKLIARDEYIKQRLLERLGKTGTDADYSYGKLSFTLAVIMETNKALFDKCYKSPQMLNEKLIEKELDKVIDRLAYKAKLNYMK